MKAAALLAVMIGSLASTRIAVANNTWFLPGDAFFFTRLTKERIVKIQKERSPLFEYGNHWDGGVGCGSAGYLKLSVPMMSPAIKAGLLRAYTALKPQLEVDEFIENKKKTLNVFIYNNGYDWKRNGIGIQYNENWVAETVKFGYQRERIRLESFFADGLHKAWRDAPFVAPLKTKFLKARKKGFPVVPKLDGEFQMIAIPNRNFSEYFTLDKDGLSLVVITVKGTTAYVSKGGKWVHKVPR